MYKGYLFLTSLLALVISYFLWQPVYQLWGAFDLISQMISDNKHFSVYLLAICISLEKYLFSSSSHLLIAFFNFCWWVLYIFWVFTSGILGLEIFSPILSVACCFFPLMYRSFLVWYSLTCLFFFYWLCLCFFFFFFFFRATPAAHGSSLARGRNGATAAGHSHNNLGSEPYLRPRPQLMAKLDP